jgi:hypothetical protein
MIDPLFMKVPTNLIGNYIPESAIDANLSPGHNRARQQSIEYSKLRANLLLQQQMSKEIQHKSSRRIGSLGITIDAIGTAAGFFLK